MSVFFSFSKNNALKEIKNSSVLASQEEGERKGHVEDSVRKVKIPPDNLPPFIFCSRESHTLEQKFDFRAGMKAAAYSNV